MLKNASIQKDQNELYKTNLSLRSYTQKFKAPNFCFKTDLDDSSNPIHNNYIKLVFPSSNSKVNTENTSLSKKSNLHPDSIREFSSKKLLKKKSDLYPDSIRELSSNKLVKKKSDLYSDSNREFSSKKLLKKKSHLSEFNKIRNTAYNRYNNLINKEKSVYNSRIRNNFDINKEKPIISKNIFENSKNNNNLKTYISTDYVYEYNHIDEKNLKINDEKIYKLAKSLHLKNNTDEKEEQKQLLTLPNNFIKIKNGYFNGMNLIISPDSSLDSKILKKNKQFSHTYLNTETSLLNKSKNIYKSQNLDYNDNNKQSIYSNGNSSKEAGGSINKYNLKNSHNISININNINNTFYNNSKININYEDVNNTVVDKKNIKEHKNSDSTLNENKIDIDQSDLPIYLREKYNIKGTSLLSPFCLKARDEFLYKKIFYDYELKKKIKLANIVNNKFNIIYAENDKQYNKKMRKYNLKLKKQGKKTQHLEGPNPVEVKLFDMIRKVKFMKKITDYAYPNMVLCKVREEKRNRKLRLRNNVALRLPPFKKADMLKKAYEKSLELHLKQSINIDKLD